MTFRKDKAVIRPHYTMVQNHQRINAREIAAQVAAIRLIMQL